MAAKKPKRPRCYFCWHNQGTRIAAVYVGAQSSDEGKTVVWRFICASHRDGWNDGGDWIAPVYKLEPDLTDERKG